MRADATRLNALLIPRGSGQSLQIVSGQTAKLVAGEVMQAVVQKAEQTGSFKIILNGENFTVKGLPVSLAGREVSFVAQQGKAGAAMGLSWLGTAAEKDEQQAANPLMQQPPVQKAQLGTLLSVLPTGIKTGHVMAARIDAIEQNRMTITLLADDSRPGQGSAAVKQQIITTPTMGLKAGQQVTINIRGQTAAGKAVVEIIPQQQTALLNSTMMPKGSSLQIVSGQTARLVTGEVMQALVQKTETAGSFKIILKDETFMVKGLPASMVGKPASFVAQQGKSGSTMGLIWVDASVNRGDQQPGQKTRQSTLLLPLPTGIKTGHVMAARIDAIEQNRMTITLLADDSRPGQGSAAVKQQIITTPTMGLKAGQQVTINIRGQTAAGKLVVEIMPQQQSHATAAKRAKADVTAAKLNMAVGDSALAVVQKRLSNGNIRINLKGMTLETAAPAQVRAGDALEIKLTKAPDEFQVVQLHKAVSQKAVTLVRQNLPTSHTPIAQNLTTIRNAVANIDSGELPNIKGLQQLESLLKATENSRDYPLHGEKLAQIIRDSGSSLESKLQTLISKGDQPQPVQHDLKAILLQISGEQHTGNKVQNSEALRLISELSYHSASRIETGQALNVLANMQGEANRFEFPMLVGQQLINVQLAVQQHEQQQNRDNQSNDNDQSFNVLFALELSGLGKMKVDANISGNTVHARIYNEHAAARGFIQEHIGRLEERLLSLGFDKVYLMSTVKAPEPEKQQRFDELATMRPTSFSLLDVLV